MQVVLPVNCAAIVGDHDKSQLFQFLDKARLRKLVLSHEQKRIKGTTDVYLGASRRRK